MAAQNVYDKIKSVFDRYGVPEFVWYPIALAESGLNPDAIGDNGASIGIFQINRVNGQGIGYTVDQLRDPVTNAEIAAKAIVPAYRALVTQVSDSQLAAEVARRSGHPGGSISNPFPITDSRIQRIQQYASDFLSSLGSVLTLSRTRSAIGSGVQSVQSDVSQEITAAVDAAVAPIKPIGAAFQSISDRFNQMGAAGLFFGLIGVLLVGITLSAMFAESDAGKAATKAVTTAIAA